MTSRTRHYISLEDLLGLNFNCRDCHTSVDIALERVNQLPQKCPNCGQAWMTPQRGDMNGSPIFGAIQQFIGQLNAMKSEAGNTTQPLNFSLTVEIEGPVSPRAL
jgi:hypothetical protein